jgi:threonine dehydratase
VGGALTLRAPTLAQVREARGRIAGAVVRTPLVRLELAAEGREPRAESPEIWLKLENLQPIGSFKLRGAMNKMRSLDPATLADGVYTASAGNMAQGVAWAARAMGIPATAIVPDTAPEAKLAAITRLGATVQKVPYEAWWSAMRTGGHPGARGAFVHPFADELVMAGNGTIALEVLEDLPDVDAILVPWGGGGLTCGIAAAARALEPRVRVFACEVEGAAPLSASLAAGEAVTIDNRRSFVDGIGGRGVFPEIWPLARELVAGVLTAGVTQVAESVAIIAQRARCVAEGAGAAPLAAALAGTARLGGLRRIVCIVSGGNIDAKALSSILAGNVP